MGELMVMRPCRLSDLPAMERIAVARAQGIGIGALPPERDRMYDMIQASLRAFAADADVSGEEVYLFVLEDVGRGIVVGTSGITAFAGFSDRYYSYRNEFTVQSAPEMGASNRTHSLHLCHNLTGASKLTSFDIDSALAPGPWSELLSRARLLFMAEHRARFSQRVVAESQGLCDAAGRSPFWAAVGQRFFNIDYAQVEQIAHSRSKSFIAELMPQYPIYVPLLPPDAQLAIGQLHPFGEVPFRILIDEGFETDTYIDIFDGGPTVDARLDALRSVRLSDRWVAHSTDRPVIGGMPHLVANTSVAQFRATVSDLGPDCFTVGLDSSATQRSVALSAQVLLALELKPGDGVRIVALCPEVN